MQNNAVVQAKPAGTLRVAVFGDSYVESLQVPREKNYTSLLSGELSARLGRPVETMNFGVSNYSVAQDYLRYLTLGRKFKPDLVVLAYRVGETEKLLPNPSKALAFVRPVFFKMADGSLKYDNSVVTDFLSSREGKRMLQTGWLRQYSHIWGVVGRMQQTSLERTENFTNEKKSTSPSLTADKDFNHKLKTSLIAKKAFVNCYWPMMNALLTKFANDCNTDGAHFLVLRTPISFPNPDGYYLEVNPLETKRLENTSRSIGASFINIDRTFRHKVQQSRYLSYFHNGGHFAAPLHKFIADELADFIVRKQILTK